MKSFVLSLTLLCSCVLPAYCQDTGLLQEPILLRFQPGLDSKFTTEFKFDFKGVSVMDGVRSEFSQSMFVLYDTRVLSSSAETTTVRSYFRVLRMTRNSEDERVKFDSSKPKAIQYQNKGGKRNRLALPMAIDPFAPSLAALAGQSLTYKVSPRGKIRDIKGLDAIARRMELGTEFPRSVALNMNEAVLRGILSQILSGISKQSLVDGSYAEKPVALGDTWVVNRESAGKMEPSHGEMAFHLQSRSDGVATILLNGLFLQGSEVANGSQTSRNSSSSSQTLNGSLQIEEKTGRQLSAALNFRALSKSTMMVDKKYVATAYLKGSFSSKIVEK